jgi:hypothetical protein
MIASSIGFGAVLLQQIRETLNLGLSLGFSHWQDIGLEFLKGTTLFVINENRPAEFQRAGGSFPQQILRIIRAHVHCHAWLKSGS